MVIIDSLEGNVIKLIWNEVEQRLMLCLLLLERDLKPTAAFLELKMKFNFLTQFSYHAEQCGHIYEGNILSESIYTKGIVVPLDFNHATRNRLTNTDTL